MFKKTDKTRTCGYNDAPINACCEDRFGISTYIDGLERYIRNCETPMTISIQGDWGSGKTSIMNMVNNRFSDDSEIKTVWFNTWQYSQFNMGDDLALAMISKLLQAMGCQDDSFKKITNLIKAFGVKVVTVLADAGGGGRAGDMVEDLLTNNRSSDIGQAVEDLIALFKKTAAATGKRLVFFIDDLDRLCPEKAVELLEVLKLFLDCENCVFVLAVDYDVVTAGIRAKYGDMGREKGRSFFDKIIQLPFKVPVAQYDINSYVETMLEKMDISADETELFSELIRTSTGFNPRSMKRLFNSFQLLDLISENTLPDRDLRRRILFAIVCMQMGFDELYRFFALAINNGGADLAIVIKGLGDAQNMRQSIDYAPLLEYVAQTDYDVEKRLDDIAEFMEYFLKAVNGREDGLLSDGDILRLVACFSCSAVTSVAGGNAPNRVELLQQSRENNRAVVERICELLSESLPEITFSVFPPADYHSLASNTEASGYATFTASEGFNFTVGFAISGDNKENRTAVIRIMVRAWFNGIKLSSEAVEKARAVIGSDPLKLGTAQPRSTQRSESIDYKIERVKGVDFEKLVAEKMSYAINEVQRFCVRENN